MPIKFACPSCKSVMTVQDSMAGKKGKCKCGSPVRVPVPAANVPAAKAAAAPVVSAALDGALGDLTESDYGSKSPYEQVYSPKKTSNESERLRKYRSEDDLASEGNRGKMTATLIFIGVLQALASVGYIVIAVLLLALTAVIANISDASPLLTLGGGVAAAVCGLFGAVMLAGAIGMFIKQKWGWIITTISYTVFAITSAAQLIQQAIAEFQQMRFFIGMISTLAALSLTAVLYNSDTRQVFRFRTALPAIVAVIVSLLISAAMIAPMFVADAPAN